MNEKILIVGFNTRPIAQSARAAGFTPVCVDYWGDLDLRSLCLDVFSILEQKPGFPLKRGRFSHSIYIEGVKSMLERHPDISFCLIGSGFDDNPDFWREISRLIRVYGNSVDTIRKCRDWRNLFNVLDNLGIPHPQTIITRAERVLDAINELGFPVVLKPTRGSGGWGKKLIKSEKDLPRNLKGDYLVQKFINGINASCSFISTDSKISFLSINEQLIGTKWLNSPGNFTYCGNIVPLVNWRQIHKKIYDYISALTSKMNFIGSNGVDFIVKDDSVYFLEVNPRFQGSLECIETVFGINIVKLHVDACKGQSSFLHQLKPKGYSCRCILYSPCNCKLIDLRKYKQVRDIPPPDIIVKRGDPICSFFFTGNSREEVIRKAKNATRSLSLELESRGLKG